jgi:hypothetical protein
MKVYGREEVQLHTLLTLYSCTLYPHTISLPLFEVLTFLLLHNIPLATKWNSSLFHSLHTLVSLFLWVTIFSQTYPHSLATLALHECVVSLTHHLLYPWEKCPEYNWAGGWMGQRFGLEALKKWKLSWPCQNLTSITLSFIWAIDNQTHQLHYHSYPFRVSLILNICVIFVRLFLQRPLLI